MSSPFAVLGGTKPTPRGDVPAPPCSNVANTTAAARAWNPCPASDAGSPSLISVSPQRRCSSLEHHANRAWATKPDVSGPHSADASNPRCNATTTACPSDSFSRYWRASSKT